MRANMSRPGFTLVELVLVIVIIVIMVAATVPAWRGFQDERIAKEPVTELALMAQEARRRAIAEARPYQIVFEESGFKATRYFDPYAEGIEIEDFLRDTGLRAEAADLARDPFAEDRAVEDGAVPELLPRDPDLALEYELPEGLRYEVRFWGEPEPVPLTTRHRSWVFQPTGICNPIRVRFEKGSGYAEASFNALTAQIDEEGFHAP